MELQGVEFLIIAKYFKASVTFLLRLLESLSCMH